jgi:hypothetical protein
MTKVNVGDLVVYGIDDAEHNAEVEVGIGIVNDIYDDEDFPIEITITKNGKGELCIEASECEVLERAFTS